MANSLSDKIESSYKYLLISRGSRSIALVFVSLAFSLYLNILGYKPIIIGLVYLLIIFFNMILSISLGMMGDRIGYSKSLIIGEIFPILGLIGLTLSTNIFVIITSAILAGITGTAGGMRGAFSPGMTSYIASNWSDESIRIKKLANINAVASFSSIFGGILLYSHDFFDSYFGYIGAFRFLFSISLIFLIISFISLFFLKEIRRPAKTTVIMKKESFRYLIRIIVPNSLNGAAIGIAIPLLPLWFELHYHLSISIIGEAFTFAYASTGLGSYISGKYLSSRRIRAISVSSLTRLIQGLLLILMALSPIGYLAIIFYAIRSGVAGTGAPMRSAISVRGIGQEDYGTASSIQGIATRSSQLTSGLSGYLMDIYIGYPLIIGGGIQMIGSFIYYALINNWEKKNI